MPVLTGIDVLGVQRYVFASNRLRDAVSASWLVHWATAAGGALDLSGRGGVLLASGGNAILQFGDHGHARDFVARYTWRLHDEAPGVEVAVAHREYEPGGLAQALAILQADLARTKLEREPSAPQLGLSVTMPCRITGMPAVGFDPQDPGVPLSRSILHLRNQQVRTSAILRWNAFLTGHDRFDLPADIDDMGRTRSDTSLVGVVHVDGNGVGRCIADWLHRCREERRSDEQTRQQFDAWSHALDEAGLHALRAVVDRVTDAIDEKGRIAGAVPDLRFDLKENSEGKVLLPLRPVLLGGDDLTFLCDGRIALDLAEAALRGFEGDIPHLGKITASAGVAIVPAHAPFERAYELAAALCAGAKRRRHEKSDNGSWIDWHIGAPRPGESIDRLRAQAYACTIGTQRLELTCRPYRLDSTPGEDKTWSWLSQGVLGTEGKGFRGAQWREHRSKAKQLASLVREGPDGVGRARQAWTVAANIELPGGLDSTNGFLDGTRTPLLDAVELLDLHLPLRGGASS